jgi:hypothetical protein
VHRTDFASLIETCSALLHGPPTIPFVSILGYVCAILQEEEHADMSFSCAIANMDCAPGDVAHLTHLLDEFVVLGLDERTPLLRMLVGASALQYRRYVSPTRLVPALGSASCIRVPQVVRGFAAPWDFHCIGAAQAGRRVHEHLIHAQFLGGQCVPDLAPVPEGFERAAVEPPADLARLVEGAGRLPEAISLAATLLEAGNREAVFYLIMALTRAGKIADAIGECAKLAEVSTQQDARTIEQALWALLGHEMPAQGREALPLVF